MSSNNFDPIGYIISKTSSKLFYYKNVISSLIGRTAKGIWNTIQDSAIATFSAIQMPIKNLVVEIKAKQDLNGFDYAWPSDGGQNMYEMELGTLIQKVYIAAVEPHAVSNLENQQARCYLFPCMPNTQYIVRSGLDSTVRAASFPESPVVGSVPVIYSEGKSEDSSVPTQITITTSETEVYLLVQIFADADIPSGVTPAQYFAQAQNGFFVSPYSNICPVNKCTEVEIIRTGENFFDGVYQIASINSNLTYNKNAAGRTAIIPIKGGLQYAVKKFDSSNRLRICCSKNIPEDGELLSLIFSSTSSATTTKIISVPEWAHYLIIFVSTSAQATEPRMTVTLGETAPEEFISYSDVSIKTVNLINSIKDVYDGELNVNTGNLVLNGRGHVFDGTEHFTLTDTKLSAKYTINAGLVSGTQQERIPYSSHYIVSSTEITPRVSLSTSGKILYFGYVNEEGTHPLSYTWYYRTSSEGNWTIPGSGAESATYRLNIKARHDGYQYKCVITDTISTIESNIVTVTVSDPPALRITQQPADVTGPIGYAAHFDVAVEGTGTKSYKWWYRTSSEAEWQQTTTSSGKTAHYSRSIAESHDGYQYKCIITNGTDTVESNVVTLAVGELALAVTQQPADYIGNVGSTMELTVAADNAAKGAVDLDVFRAYLAEQYAAGTPVTVVWKIAEPITVQVEPTLIYAYPGVNNIWANTGDIKELVYCSGVEEPPDTSYLTFSSDESFSLGVRNGIYWDGEVEYSTDARNWLTWDGTSLLYSENNKLYLRGINNTVFSTNLSIESTSGVSCEGNIETLLDYQTVTNGGHPQMGNNCFYGLFGYCTTLISSPELPATTLTQGCYEYMFSGCTSITSPPELPATTLANSCYYGMFTGCTSLTAAPELSATTLADSCYNNMFSGCTSLITAPVLPATILTQNCYYGMFRGCTLLISAPELPATTLANYCYSNMFFGCISLTSAPTLSADILARNCYEYMFYGCTSLTEAPELPATTIANFCYNYMFYGCESLTTAPELPATTLAIRCYDNMFRNCTSLKTAPELPATALANYCYASMFSGCTSIKLSQTQTLEYTIPYRIPSVGDGSTATDSLTNMFNSTGGTFTGTPEINTTYYLAPAQ